MAPNNGSRKVRCASFILPLSDAIPLAFSLFRITVVVLGTSVCDAAADCADRFARHFASDLHEVCMDRNGLCALLFAHYDHLL